MGKPVRTIWKSDGNYLCKEDAIIAKKRWQLLDIKVYIHIENCK